MAQKIMNTGLFQFGQDVAGYPVRVLNERAVRAAAGLLLAGAFMSFANAMLLGNFVPTRVFVLLFVVDMAIRVFVNPLYAPSLIVGGWVVRHQTPEWTGAPQKRFAWGLGLMLGLVMIWTLVVQRTVGPLNMLVCGTCLVLMFFETAFGICLGCKLYNLFPGNRAQLCPGGVCEAPPAKVVAGVSAGKLGVLVVFVLYAVAVVQWVHRTGPAATPVSLQRAAGGPGPADAAEAERCKVPEFAKAIGHEQMWKQHNNCP